MNSAQRVGSGKRDPLSFRFYRVRWSVEKGVKIRGAQPLDYRRGRATQQHYLYPEFVTRRIGLEDEPFRYPWQPRNCIYCSAEVYSSTRAKMGEEHLIPEGIGGTLILGSASCQACELPLRRRLSILFSQHPAFILGFRPAGRGGKQKKGNG